LLSQALFVLRFCTAIHYAYIYFWSMLLLATDARIIDNCVWTAH